MTTFTIDTDNNISAFANPQEAEAAASGQSFASQDALGALTGSWPMDRFVTVWNSFAGVAGFGADLKPIKKFENRDKAVARIWKVWLSEARTSASRWKRAMRPGSPAKASGNTFSAASRLSLVSRARYTSPMPPAPILKCLLIGSAPNLANRFRAQAIAQKIGDL
jgi:hypothetical protein